MSNDACTNRCISATEKWKDGPEGFSRFHNCMKQCGAAEDVRKQACRESTQKTADDILWDRFIVRAHDYVVPLFRAGKEDQAVEVTRGLYLGSFRLLMEARERLAGPLPSLPDCRDYGHVFDHATHTLLGLKYDLLHKGEDFRTWAMGRDPTTIHVGIPIPAVTGGIGALAGGACSFFTAASATLSATLTLFGAAIGEGVLVGLSYAGKKLDLDTPLSLPPSP